MTKFTQRINSIEPSPTLAISSKASELRRAGKDVISFGTGEPDLPTPQPIVEAAKRALDDGQTKYVDSAGLPQLRQKIAKDYERRGRQLSSDQVIVTVGAKQALYNTMQVLFEPGDKVVVPAPHWVTYPAQVSLAGGEPVIERASLEQDYKLSPEKLDRALERSEPKGLILCSPSNPTGAVYTKSELEALGDVLESYPNTHIIFDAIYDQLYYGDGLIAPDLGAVKPSLSDRLITINGFSKSYSMTGWRLGFALAPTSIIDQMAKLQSQSTSNATTFAQFGALAALDISEQKMREYAETFRQRRDVLLPELDKIDGLEAATPGGAFYAFPRVTDILENSDRFETDQDLSKYLISEALVATVPGSAFGSPGHIRLSYACNEQKIREGMSRIQSVLN